MCRHRPVDMGDLCDGRWLLIAYDQHPNSLHPSSPIPNRPYSMTINSLIAVFSTIMKSAMLLCAAECISQSKWIWFRANEIALTDIEVYDIASRGPWGPGF